MVSYVMAKKHTFFLIFGFLLFIYLVLTLPFLNKIYPNVYVANIYLGDKTRDAAINDLKNIELADTISLKINNETKEIKASEVVKEVKYQETIDRSYNYTNSGNYFLDLVNKGKLVFSPINLPLSIDFDDQKITETLLILTAKEGSKPIKPSAKITSGQIVVDAGKNGVEVDVGTNLDNIKQNLVFNKKDTVEIKLVESKVALNADQAKSYKERTQKLVGKNIELALDFDKVTISDKDLVSFIDPIEGFNKETIKTKIAEVSRKINRNPQDSVFIVSNGSVTEFTPSKDGITVNENDLIKEIEKYLTQLIEGSEKSYSITIPTVKSPAKIKTGDINNLGIKTLLGKGVSHFAGSIPNRIHNVNLAQSKFKGILVPPNEIFSFNEVLGDVSAYTGYKSAYVIKDGKTVLGDGGGVCQVSTTLFRAILSAGLPIVERKPHSYRVGYYEQGFGPGLDATVYYPTTDLKFKNDTEAYLLIQPTIDNPGYTLTFEIYGTSDGRVSTVTKPIITSSTAPAADLYVDDPTLKTGVVKQIEHRAYGARVVFDYKVERNGEVLIDQKFVSNYRPWQAVYLRGTATQ